MSVGGAFCTGSLLGDTCWCGLESRGTGLSAREAGGRVGKWRSGGARFLGCARAAEAGGELVIVSRKGVSRGGGGGAATRAGSSRGKGRAKDRAGPQEAYLTSNPQSRFSPRA